MPVVGGQVNGSKLSLWSPVTDFLAVGQFTDCSTGDDQAIFDVGEPVILTSGGELRGTFGAPVQLPDFDSCEPWFIRLTYVDVNLEVKVWQATATEPEAAQTSVPTTGERWLIEIATLGSGSGVPRELLIDWLNFSVAWTG